MAGAGAPVRDFKAGEVICWQGDPGWTAFAILTANDLRALHAERQRLLAELPDKLQKAVAGNKTEDVEKFRAYVRSDAFLAAFNGLDPERRQSAMLSHAIAQAMHVCGVSFPPDRDELQAAGLTAMPGKMVASPWIKEAPAAFECRRHLTLELGKSRQIILGEILFAHYHSDVIDPDRLHIDPAKLDAIARLGGNTCSTIRDRFDMLTPTLEDLSTEDLKRLLAEPGPAVTQ